MLLVVEQLLKWLSPLERTEHLGRARGSNRAPDNRKLIGIYIERDRKREMCSISAVSVSLSLSHRHTFFPLPYILLRGGLLSRKLYRLQFDECIGSILLEAFPMGFLDLLYRPVSQSSGFLNTLCGYAISSRLLAKIRNRWVDEPKISVGTFSL